MQRHLHLLAWSVFITNVPRDWLAAKDIMLLYRLRWQVELIFKLWKSLAKLDAIAHCGPHRFLCQFYARLLALLVFGCWMSFLWMTLLPNSACLKPLPSFNATLRAFVPPSPVLAYLLQTLQTC